MPVTSAGYLAYTASEWEAIVQANISAQFAEMGLDAPDYTPDTVMGALSTVFSALLAEIDGYFEAGVAFTFDPNSATGSTLDALCALVGVSRQQATKASATVTLTGTAGVVVPAGTLFQGGTSNLSARWVLDTPATIGGGGTVSAEIEAVEAGYLTAAAGTITTIATPVAGLASVTNPAAAVEGQATETDAALRLRRTQALSVPGGGSIGAMRSKLLELDYVEAAAVIENTANTTATVAGFSLPPKSFAVQIAPSTLSTEQKEGVAEVIYLNAPAGIEIAALAGAYTVNITGGDGYTKTIYFSPASTLTVNVVATVTVKAGYTLADVTQGIKDAVTNYINSLGVGDTVYILQTLAAIASIAGVATATVTLNGASTDRVPLPSERPITGTVSVV